MSGIKQHGNSSSLYISGMPGTGKTATTMEVIRGLQGKFDFDFVHINAMSLTNPNLVYTILFETITSLRVCPQTAALFLDDFFKKRQKEKFLMQVMARKRRQYEWLRKEVQKRASRVRLVLVDELDALITSKQSLLYNLFDWPCHSESNLVVIAIANTMDLPERL